MAYRFKFNESLTRGVRRIGLSQLELAESRLKDADNPAKAVHEVRKSLKRARALLRLVRPALGDKVYHQANVELRDLGRLLSEARDRDVMRDTVAKLEAMIGSSGKGACERLHTIFLTDEGKAAGVLDRARLRQAKSSLAVAKRHLGAIHVDGSGFASVETGLRDTHKAGRRALGRVLEAPDDEAFHELRKCVQQHWRHMLLVSHAWPQVCRARATAAREIAQLLGEEHDFTILAELVASRSPAELPDHDRRLIEKACKAHQRELRTLAALKTRRLFAEKAGVFARQIAVCWDAARELAKREKKKTPHRPKSPARRQSRARRARDD